MGWGICPDPGFSHRSVEFSPKACINSEDSTLSLYTIFLILVEFGQESGIICGPALIDSSGVNRIHYNIIIYLPYNSVIYFYPVGI